MATATFTETWSTDHWGNTVLTCTPSPPYNYRPPDLNGQRPDFIGVHGADYVRWTYYKKNQP